VELETLDYAIILDDGNVGRQNQRVAIWAYGLSKCSHLAMSPLIPNGANNRQCDAREKGTGVGLA